MVNLLSRFFDHVSDHLDIYTAKNIYFVIKKISELYDSEHIFLQKLLSILFYKIIFYEKFNNF